MGKFSSFEEVYNKYKDEVKDYTPKSVKAVPQKPVAEVKESIQAAEIDDVMDRLGEFFAIPAGERKFMQSKLYDIYERVKGMTGKTDLDSIVSYLRSMEEKGGARVLGVDRLTTAIGRLKTMTLPSTIRNSGTENRDRSKGPDIAGDTAKDAGRVARDVPQKITVSIEGIR